MKDMQQTLDAFFRIEPKTRKVKKEKLEVLITRAKEVLEPLFIQVKPGTVQITKISGLAIKHLQKN